MIIGLLAFVAALGFFIWLLTTKKITPEQEAEELRAKAGAEAEQIEADLAKELSAVEADVKTPLVNAEKSVAADIKKL